MRFTDRSCGIYQVTAPVIGHALRQQGERLRSVNCSGIQVADHFGFEDLLRAPQGRRRQRLNPDRLVIDTAQERSLAMLHRITQRQSSLPAAYITALI